MGYTTECPGCRIEFSISGMVMHLACSGKLRKRFLLCAGCAKKLQEGTKRQQGRIRANLIKYVEENHE